MENADIGWHRPSVQSRRHIPIFQVILWSRYATLNYVRKKKPKPKHINWRRGTRIRITHEGCKDELGTVIVVGSEGIIEEYRGERDVIMTIKVQFDNPTEACVNSSTVCEQYNKVRWDELGAGWFDRSQWHKIETIRNGYSNLPPSVTNKVFQNTPEISLVLVWSSRCRCLY